MGRRWETLYLVAADRDHAERLQELEPDMPLHRFLDETGAAIHTGPARLDRDRPVGEFLLEFVRGEAPGRPRERHVRATPSRPTPFDDIAERYALPEGKPRPADAPPLRIPDDTAVFYAYQEAILDIRKYLEHDLSVFVQCDKVLVSHVVRNVFNGCAKRPVLDTFVPEDEEGGEGRTPLLQQRVERARSGARVQVGQISRLFQNLKADEVLVLKSLDVMTTISESMLTEGAKGMIEILYREAEKVVLGFVDPALRVPEIVQKRFSIRVEIDRIDPKALPRLVTAGERSRFARFEPRELYKQVSGLNAVQFRDAMRYLEKECAERSSTDEVNRSLRRFKKANNTDIEIPEVTFEDIGGYEEVKKEIRDIIALINGDFSSDPAERDVAEHLVPSGLLFHGPPGTGKTLFSKAIANRINATVQVVSGPEVMSRWVGESEERVRRIFETARRNAPSVIVFDEFDSIAARRSGGGDGGSRAGNAVVAQLLTEMDGFRTGERILVIGTTNRPDIIDRAFKERPDRMVPIEIPLPDDGARRKIGEIYGKKFRLPVVDARLAAIIAEFTEGFNGDEIQSIFREAKRRELLGGQPADARLFGALVARRKKRKEEARKTHLG